MSYLELLRVFPLELDTLALPFWSWERWIAVVLLVAANLTMGMPLRAWMQTSRALSRIFGSKISDESVGNFGAVTVGVITVIGVLAGSLYCVAALFWPESLTFYRDHGIATFAELDVAGWILVASLVLMAWLIIYLLLGSIAHFTVIPGLIHMLPWAFYAGTAFLLGMLVGPVGLFLVLHPRNLVGPNARIYVSSYLFFPFRFFTRGRLTSPFSGLSRAIDRSVRF